MCKRTTDRAHHQSWFACKHRGDRRNRRCGGNGADGCYGRDGSKWSDRICWLDGCHRYIVLQSWSSSCRHI